MPHDQRPDKPLTPATPIVGAAQAEVGVPRYDEGIIYRSVSFLGTSCQLFFVEHFLCKTKSAMSLMGTLYCRRKNEWPACENLEKKYARALSTLPKREKRAPKVDGFAAHFACGFFGFLEGWNALAHRFSRSCRTLAINSFRRQYKQIAKNDFSSPTPNRLYSIS